MKGGAKKWLKMIKRNKDKFNMNKVCDAPSKTAHLITSHCMNKKDVDSILLSASYEDSQQNGVASQGSIVSNQNKVNYAFLHNPKIAFITVYLYQQIISYC